MADPIVSQKSPYAVEVQEGTHYFWCACGRSATQPFCDGAHKDTGITPQRYTATKTGMVYFCGCKKSEQGPLCDGAHNRL